MKEKGNLDWTDLYEGRSGEPEDPRSRPVARDGHKGGEKVTEDDLKKDVDFILEGFKQQGIASPSKEEFEAIVAAMHPELSKTEEEWQEVENRWDNFFSDFFSAGQTKIGDKEPVDWGTGESFRDRLTKSEKDKYEEEEKKFNEELTR